MFREQSLISVNAIRLKIPWIGGYADRVQRSPLAWRLLHGTFWSLAGTVCSKALGFGTAVVLARVLGTQDFGAFGIIQGTVAMFQVFAGFGLGLTATKYVAELRSKDPERAGRIIALSSTVGALTGLVVCLCMYAGSGWLAAHTLAAPRLAPLLRLAAFTLLLTAVNGAQMGSLTGFEGFKKIAQINVITGLIYVPVVVVGVVFGGLHGAVYALLVNAGFCCLVGHFALRREVRRYRIRVRLHHSFKELPVLWKFSVPAVLSGLLVTPATWIASALLVQRPGGYAQMGIFNAASQFRNLLMFVPMMLMQASLPVLSSKTDESGSSDFRQTLNISQSIMVGISFPLAAFLMFVAGPVLQMYGKDFRSGQTVLIGVVLTALVQCIGAAAGPAIEAKGRMWTAMGINWSWAALYVAFVYPSVGRFGADALAYGSAAAYILMTIGGFVYIRRDLPEGMLRRIHVSLIFAVFLAIASLLTPGNLRLYAALPTTALAAVVAVTFLTDQSLVRKLRGRSAAAVSDTV